MCKRWLMLVILLLAGLLGGQAQNNAETWHFENFDSYDPWGDLYIPAGWDAHDKYMFKNMQGVDRSLAIGATMNDASIEYWFSTPAWNVGASPVVEFEYKTSGIIGEAPDSCMSLALFVSTDDGTTWTRIDSISAKDYASSSTYAAYHFALPESYANQTCKIKVSTRITGINGGTAINFYVDNFGVGTEGQAETPACDMALQGSLQGPSMPTLHAEAIYTVNTRNNGSAACAYSLHLLNGQDTLASFQAPSLEAGAERIDSLKWIPSQAGNYNLQACIVAEEDENTANNLSDTLKVNVPAQQDLVAVELGHGNEMDDQQPFAFLEWDYGISQVMYKPEELSFQGGRIKSLLWEGDFAVEFTADAMIWIGETDSASLYRGWVDPAGLKKVFQGQVTASQGERQQVRIDLDTAFEYTGTRNLVIYTYSENVAPQLNEESEAALWYGADPMGTPLSRAWQDDGEGSIDPEHPAGGWDRTYRPNLILLMEKTETKYYSLAFNVSDENGIPVSDAVITLNDTLAYPAGEYLIDSLPSGMYTYRVDKKGYVTARGTVGLDQDRQIDVVLNETVSYPGISAFLYEDFEDIEENKKPYKWDGVSGFYAAEGHGVDGSMGLSHNFFFMDGPRSIVTNPVFMGENPVFEMDYRVMGCDPGYGTYLDEAFAGQNLSWAIRASLDNGQTWENVYFEDFGQHVPTAEFKHFRLDLAKYANQVCLFQIYVERNQAQAEAFWFDMDNIQIGTRTDTDLSIVSGMEGLRVTGAGVENDYSIVVRNTGKNDIGNYTVKLFDGETEIGSVSGENLAMNQFARHSFKHAFEETGDHTLQASILCEGDMVEIGNISSEYYVSVMDKDVTTYMLESHEGEDLYHTTPMNFYSPYSLSEILYLKQQLPFESGCAINGIAFRTAFSTPVERTKLTVWVGETDSSSLYVTRTPMASMTKVFEGAIDISDRDGDNLVIPFQTPYLYQGNNLSVTLYKESETAYQGNEDLRFYGIYHLNDISIVSSSSDGPIDLNDNTTQGKTLFHHPSTIFLTTQEASFYNVTFNVIDQNNNPVSNAVLTFNGTELPEGQYVIENVADGTYPYSASLNGETVDGTVTVAGADVTETVQFQHVANEFNASKNMIRVYPNPTVDKIHIDVAEGAREIGLYDISGRLVRKASKVPAGVMEMDLSGCRNGLYLLMVDGQAFKVTKR